MKKSSISETLFRYLSKGHLAHASKLINATVVYLAKCMMRCNVFFFKKMFSVMVIFQWILRNQNIYSWKKYITLQIFKILCIIYTASVRWDMTPTHYHTECCLMNTCIYGNLIKVTLHIITKHYIVEMFANDIHSHWYNVHIEETFEKSGMWRPFFHECRYLFLPIIYISWISNRSQIIQHRFYMLHKNTICLVPLCIKKETATVIYDCFVT